jgi:Family of unknown function (DUF5681)
MPQFRKGQSGNPAGRPPGSRNRATSMVQNLLEGAAENIAKRAAQLAEEGNVAAIRICMNRLSPVSQHNPVAFELPPIHSPQDCLRATSTILTGIASGDIAPSAALQIARLIDVEAVNHACCRPCYRPVRGAAGFAFCQPVQIDDEGSL